MAINGYQLRYTMPRNVLVVLLGSTPRTSPGVENQPYFRKPPQLFSPANNAQLTGTNCYSRPAIIVGELFLLLFGRFFAIIPAFVTVWKPTYNTLILCLFSSWLNKWNGCNNAWTYKAGTIHSDSHAMKINLFYPIAIYIIHNDIKAEAIINVKEILVLLLAFSENNSVPILFIS